MASELDSAELALIGCKTTPTREALSLYLRLARELRIRDSEPIARYGSLLLKQYRGSLGEEEFWLVHEQAAIAMLDSGVASAAQPLIKAIAIRFPKSSRTIRLQGMYFEAGGDFDTAAELYTEALAEDPSNPVFHKRLVAVEKSRGNVNAAIEGLKKYLETFQGDQEAWEELGQLYLDQQMYKQALFCCEELIMFGPSPQRLVRYADILYTLGNFRMARSYYAKAVEASSGSSARALFGLLQCFANITERVALQDARTRAQMELPDLTAQALIKMYRQHAPDKLHLLEPTLRAQGLLE
ncbi:hypothetical protein FOA52_013373 [Chlamydomonas sp. UWO 241]|nr:hypothetical protein FOA52_013373 [Chlamydomonas sp. UWO 241]